MIRQPRTDIDWSEHKIIENHSKNCKIWSLKKPGTNIYAVHFVNAMGVMSVTGDLGNWIFCREFHPSEIGRVSDSYWCEKLRISSKQNHNDYNADKTEAKIIKYLKKDIWDCYGSERPKGFKKSLKSFIEDGFYAGDEFEGLEDSVDIDDRLSKEVFWLLDCLQKVHEGEERYLCFAYDGAPSNCDHEDIIVHYDVNHQLQGVFDAFDEMCRRMEADNAKQ